MRISLLLMLLTCLTRAAVQAMLPAILSQLKPLLAAELTSDIDRAMAFQLEKIKDALQKD
jgi:hypothetical protein